MEIITEKIIYNKCIKDSASELCKGIDFSTPTILYNIIRKISVKEFLNNFIFTINDNYGLILESKIGDILAFKDMFPGEVVTEDVLMLKINDRYFILGMSSIYTDNYIQGYSENGIRISKYIYLAMRKLENYIFTKYETLNISNIEKIYEKVDTAQKFSIYTSKFHICSYQVIYKIK